MTIASDFAQWCDAVAACLDAEHDRVSSSRPLDNSAEFPAWQRRMKELHDQYASLSGCAMALRNIDGQATMQQISPQLAAIQDQTQRAQETITTINNINGALNLVAAFVGVAAAIALLIPDPLGGVGGLVSAGQALDAALH